MNRLYVHGYDDNNNLSFTFVIDEPFKRHKLSIKCFFDFNQEQFFILNMKGFNFKLMSFDFIVKEFNNILQHSKLTDLKHYPLQRTEVMDYIQAKYPKEFELMCYYEEISHVRNLLSPIYNYFSLTNERPNWFDDLTIKDIILREQDICFNSIKKIKKILDKLC